MNEFGSVMGERAPSHSPEPLSLPIESTELERVQVVAPPPSLFERSDSEPSLHRCSSPSSFASDTSFAESSDSETVYPPATTETDTSGGEGDARKNGPDVGEQAPDIQCLVNSTSAPGIVCTTELPSIYVPERSPSGNATTPVPCPEIEVEGDWSDSKQAQVLRRILAVKEERKSGHRKPIAVKPARGSALGTPAHRFFVSYTPQYHMRRIGSMLSLGTGAGRRVPKPTGINECLAAAKQTDLTGDFLLKIQKYSNMRSVQLGQFTVRKALSLAAITRVRDHKYSVSTLQTWHDLIRAEQGRARVVPIMTLADQGFGHNYLPITPTTVAKIRRQVQQDDKTSIVTAFRVGQHWWGMVIDIQKRSVQLTTNDGMEESRSVQAVRDWLGSYHMRGQGFKNFTVTTTVDPTWNAAQWLVSVELGWSMPENDADFARWMGQSLYRGSLGWKSATLTTDSPQPEPAQAKEDLQPPQKSMSETLRSMLERGTDKLKVREWLDSQIDDEMLAAFDDDCPDGFGADDHPAGWNPPEDKPPLNGVRGCRVISQVLGPVGIRKGWQEVIHTIHAHNPSVATFLDVKAPRHRLRQLNKWTERDLPEYTMYAELGEGQSATGLITFIRNDLTPTLTRLEMRDDFEQATTGRILALQTQGVGAENPITFVGVYMPVNVKDNMNEFRLCLRALTDIRNRCAINQIPLIVCGDWNATLTRGQRWGYTGSGWEEGDAMFRQFVTEGQWKAVEPNQGTEPTWHSKSGRQRAVLDRALVYPPFLRTTDVAAHRADDSRFDHHQLVFDIDGRDGGFDVERSEFIQEQLRLDLDKWDDKFLNVHRRWSPNLQATTKWGRLRQSLFDYVEVAGDVMGWISNLKEKKQPFQMKGHKQLHREIHQLRDVRKEIYEMPDPLRIGDRRRVADLYDKLHTILRSTPLTRPQCMSADKQQTVRRDDVIADLSDLIKERETKVDEEVGAAQKKNIEDIVKRMRQAFTKPGTKAMKQLLGKLGPRKQLWGIETNYPDTIKAYPTAGQSIEDLVSLIDGTDTEISIEDGGLLVRCRTLIEVGEVLVLLSPGARLELVQGLDRIVTTPSDKLSAEEAFFGANAMSRQDSCVLCNGTELTSISRMIQGQRMWGVWCSSCQTWAKPTNKPRDFTHDSYASSAYDGIRTVPSDTDRTVRGKLDKDDLIELLQHLPRWKATGSDKVPNELLRECPEALVDMLHDALDEMLQGGELPAEFKEGLIKLLEKKQPASLLRNQRPVCCSQTVYKVLSSVITNRLTKMLEQHGVIEPDQEGAQRAHSTKRQFQKLVHIYQDAQRNSKQLYVCYADWQNAYNSCDQDVIWKCLSLAGIQEKDIDIIRELYRDMSFRVQNTFGTTASIPLKTGVNQGDPLSGILFLTVINVLLRKLNESGLGYRHSNGEVISVTAFSDDLAIITDDPKHMQALLNIISEFSSWSGMKIAHNKTEISAYDFRSRAPLDTDSLLYRGKPFPNLHPTQPFKYLGIKLTLTLDWKFEKQAVKEKIRKAIDLIRGTAYTYDQLDSVVRMCIVPLFRYSAALTPWTPSELQELSLTFARALKVAWKLPRGFSTAVLQTPSSAAGLDAPIAEIIQLHEMIGLYEQSYLHKDGVRRMMDYELDRAKTYHGCNGVRELAAEVAMAGSRDTFIERLLSSVHQHGLSIDAEVTQSNTISAATRQWRTELHEEIQHYKDDGLQRFLNITGQVHGLNLHGLVRNKLVKDKSNLLALCQGALRIFKQNGITEIQQLVATRDGDWIRYFVAKRKCPGLSNDQFRTIIEVLDRSVSKRQRQGFTDQTSLPDSYEALSHREHVAGTKHLFPERPVPPAFQHQVRRYSDSGEGTILRADLISKLQGEFPVRKVRSRRQRNRKHSKQPTPRIQTTGFDNVRSVTNEVVTITERRTLLLCSFINEPCNHNTLVRNFNSKAAKAYMARHNAHITIPQDLDFFFQPDDPGSAGEHVIRVDSIHADGELECTVVQGPWPEIGKTVKFPYKPVQRVGQVTSGLYRLIKDMPLRAVCVRGDEWVDEALLGVDGSDTAYVHPSLHRYWATTNHRERLFQYTTQYPRRSTTTNVDTPRARQGMRCPRCSHRFMSTQCQTECYPHCALPLPERKREATPQALELGKTRPAQHLVSNLQRRREQEEWEKPLPELVKFDLSSSANRPILQSDEGTVLLRNNVAIVSYKFEMNDNEPCRRIHYPLFRVLQARGLDRVAQVALALQESRAIETCHRHLHPNTAALLSRVDGADIGVGFDVATIGPVFQSLQQKPDSKARVLNLTTLNETDAKTATDIARQAARQGAPVLIVAPTSRKGTSPLEHHLHVWARPCLRLSSKTPIWQQKASATRGQPKVCGGQAVQIWMAGPRDSDRDKRCQQIMTAQPRYNEELHAAWVDANQGRQYDEVAGMLAATDGSVGRNAEGIETMGAGVCFRDNELPDVAVQVPGDPCSLRAEAAAMLELLTRAPVDVQLTVLCDSLSLLRLLKNYHRRDFRFLPVQHRQRDIITGILSRLRERSKPTLLVKVKSHTGIPLNEQADELAKAGLDSDLTTYQQRPQDLPFTIGGQRSIHVQLREAKLRWHEKRLRWHELHTTNGITTLMFRTKGHGQQHMASALRSLPAGSRRRWYLSMCDSYPTQYYRYRTNQVDSPECRLEGCAKRETYDHMVCACGPISDAITAAHDKVWKSLYDSIVSLLPKGHTTHFDTPMSKSGLRYQPSSRKAKPDGITINEGEKVISVLEFTRTGDYRPEYIAAATARKTSKYGPLCEELRLLYPDYTVQLVPFVIGARSFIVHDDWVTNWASLGLPESKLPKIISTTMARNQEVIDGIVAVRKANRAAHPPKGDG